MSPPELLLLRHGIAVERDPAIPDDARALTPAGRRRTQAVVERLVALGLHSDRLVSSPLLRARQTAELAVAAGLAPALEVDPALAPEGDPWSLLRWPAGIRRLALVGHEPDLGNLAAALIGAPAGSVVVKKAGVVLLQLAMPPATPGLSRAQAGSGLVRLRLLLGPSQLLAGS